MNDKKLEIHKARLENIESLLDIEKEIWGEHGATKEMLRSRIKVFPDGQLVSILNNEIIGSLFTQRINAYEWENDFTWEKITDNGMITLTHSNKGDLFYGISLTVKKTYQRLNVPIKLMLGIAQLVIQSNARGIMFGARIPGYYRYPNMDPTEYINWKKNKRHVDPEIYIYQKHGISIVKILPNYFCDPKSKNFGVLMKWENPHYNHKGG